MTLTILYQSGFTHLNSEKLEVRELIDLNYVQICLTKDCPINLVIRINLNSKIKNQVKFKVV